jgi:hypothetical protein
MECLAVPKLPEGPAWVWEIKVDGYRAEAVKSNGDLWLFSRNQKSFKTKFPLIYEGLVDLPDNTVLDGEIVALGESGLPNFHLLQNSKSAATRIHYFVFVKDTETHPPPFSTDGRLNRRPIRNSRERKAANFRTELVSYDLVDVVKQFR